MTYQPWQDLQAKCDELVRQWRDGITVDLTAGYVDVTEDHDPVGGGVLEEVAHVA